MGFILRLIIGLGIAAAGVAFVLKTPMVVDLFGPVPWAEAKLGSTSLFYKLLGIVVILIGFIVAFNLWDAFLQATFGSLFPQRTS